MLARVGGALLLAACGLLVGRELTRRDRARLACLSGLLSLLRYTREEIAAYRTPLARILCSFQNEALENGGFLPILRTKGLCAALLTTRETLALPCEVETVLLTVGEHIGRVQATEAVALCDRAIRCLEETLAVGQRESVRQARVRGGLLTTGVLMLIVLLL